MCSCSAIPACLVCDIWWNEEETKINSGVAKVTMSRLLMALARMTRGTALCVASEFFSTKYTACHWSFSSVNEMKLFDVYMWCKLNFSGLYRFWISHQIHMTMKLFVLNETFWGVYVIEMKLFEMYMWSKWNFWRVIMN